MPIKATITPATGRRAVRPLPQGGFEDAENIPNPNSGATIVSRAQNATLTNDLGNGVRQILSGLATHRADDFAHSTATRALGAPAVLNTVALDPKWEALKQALFEQGVTELQTGAASGSSGGVSPFASSRTGDTSEHPLATRPGFFDTQQARMSRAFNTMTPRERLLLEEMKKQTPSLRGGR